MGVFDYLCASWYIGEDAAALLFDLLAPVFGPLIVWWCCQRCMECLFPCCRHKSINTRIKELEQAFYNDRMQKMQ